MIEINKKKIDPKGLISKIEIEGWRNMSELQYHEDKCAVNSSSLKMMSKSAFSFAHTFWGRKKETNPSMDLGKIIHLAILEPLKFSEKMVVEPYFEGPTQNGKMSPNSKIAKEKRAAWRIEQDPSSFFVTQEEKDDLVELVHSVMSHPAASAILKNSASEQIGYWRDEETCVNLRMMCDCINWKHALLVDLKSSQSCEWNFFRNSIESYRYDHQMMMYSAGIEKISKTKIQNRAWIVVENKYPFETRVFEMSSDYERAGEFQFRKNLNDLIKCIDDNRFDQGNLEAEIGECSSWFRKTYEKLGVI